MNVQSLVLDLHRIGCIQFGRFRLKSGLISPIYLDLRLLISEPRLLQAVAEALAGLIQGDAGGPALTFDRLAAIPYAALPIGVALALKLDRPLIYPRRETKPYGTERPIEGHFQAGERVLLLDDLITQGESKLEAIATLEQAGLVVEDVVVVVDREQGGGAALAERGYRLHSLLRLGEMLDLLAEAGAITPERRDEVRRWMRESVVRGP